MRSPVALQSRIDRRRSKYLPHFYAIKGVSYSDSKAEGGTPKAGAGWPSARFLSGEQLVDRAEKFRLWPRPLARPLSLETSPQPKARRLRRVVTPAVLSAANPATTLLHRSSLVPSGGPSDAEVWCTRIARAGGLGTVGPSRGREAPPLPFAIVEYVAIVQAPAGVPNCKGAKP